MEAQTKGAVVVGGTGGIGSEIVHRLLQQSYAVSVISRGVHPQGPLIENTSSSGSRLRFYDADATDETSLAKSIDDIAGWMKMEVVVYTAGGEPEIKVPLLEYPSSNWQETFALNVHGCFYCFKHAVPKMETGGHFAVLSSAITRFTSANLPPFHACSYASAKAAVDEFCKWARREAHERGILLSRIAPSAVDTPIFHRNFGGLGVRPIPVSEVADKLWTAVKNRREVDGY
jgi:NAD(P)-dependent dehydrogenase (short-subunit alcohol dehydrogenase family)